MKVTLLCLDEFPGAPLTPLQKRFGGGRGQRKVGGDSTGECYDDVLEKQVAPGQVYKELRLKTRLVGKVCREEARKERIERGGGLRLWVHRWEVTGKRGGD